MSETAPRIARFDFRGLRDFGEPFTPKPVATASEPVVVEMAPPPPPPPTYNETQLSAAYEEGRAAGRQEGILDGIAQAQNEQSRHQELLQQAIASLAQQAEALQGGFAARYDAYYQDTLQLAVAVARQVCATALAQMPGAMVESLIGQCLPVLIRQPKITATVHPDLEASTRDTLETLCTRAGYHGEIDVRGQPDMAPHDAILSWADGSAETTLGTVWQTIEQTLTRTTKT